MAANPLIGTPSLAQPATAAASAPVASPPQVTLQGLGQQQPQATGPAPLPVLQPYTALQPYYGAIGQQPQYAMPQVTDPTLQDIQQKLQATAATQPVLTGGQAPHPQSVLARQQAPMSPLEIVGAAGQALWGQEVVKPVQDYIQTWQQNPLQALAETAVGIGTVAAIVGLEAATGGLATPIIFGAFAAMAAPSIVQSWAQEVSSPSDGHLVQALVSTGAGVLSVGSPVRAFKGIQTGRQLLDGALAARREIADADQAAGLILGGRAAAGDIRTGVPLERQIEVLSPDPEVALRQFQDRGADLEQGPAAAYMAAARAQQALAQRLQTAREGGDTEAVTNLLGEIRDHARNSLAPAMLGASHEHLMIPGAPYTHVPVGPIEGVPSELQQSLDEHMGAVRGLLRELHSGNALQGLHEPATRIESALEQEGLDRAAGTAWDMGNRVITRVEQMAREAGLDGLNDPRVEDMLQALEEPEKWEALAPEEKALTQGLRGISDMLTAGELRFGTIALPLLGRVAHYVRGVGGEQEAEPIEMFSSWWRSPTGSRSRFWRTAVDDETGAVRFLPRTRAEIIRKFKQQTAFYEQTHEQRQAYAANRSRINSMRRSFGQINGDLKRAIEQGDDVAEARLRGRINQLLVQAHQEMGAAAPELVSTEAITAEQLAKVRRAMPATQELVTGGEAVRQMLARHLQRMHMAVIGDGLRSHANLDMQRLRDIFGETPMKSWGAAMELPSFRSQHELPDIVEGDIFRGQGQNAGSVEQNAQRLGYFLAHPAIGSPGDLHYRPALYARGELANQIRQAEAASSAAELQSGALNALYNVATTSKRFIMYNPLFHRMNTGGRAFSFLLSDPVVARSAFKAVGELKKDSEAYYALIEEAGQAGLVHANKWNVSGHLQLLQREEDGQHHFLGAVRNFGRAINDWHSEHLERGLWNSVDNTQLAAYLYMKQRMLGKGIGEVDARRASAQYANMLGGMVNPLYMSRLWRHLKGLVWFAPSYWATFLHSLQSMMPGAARLSQFMAEAGGGRFVRFSAVPLRSLDYRARLELVRAQRSWMLTYLSTAAVSMDLMNVMFSGHHLWDNEQGRQFDIDVTNLIGTQQSPSGEPRRAYVTTMPFFRQAVDVGNAIGLGQDYGFAHTFSDQTWQQQDGLHKAEMLAGALADGVRRQAATKVGPVPQAGYEATTGQSFTANVGEGIQQQVDRPEALLSLMPNGYQVQRLIKQYQQEQAQVTGQQPPASAFLQDATMGMLSSLTGLPSIYHMGVEVPPVDDQKFQNWQQQRTSIHDSLLAYSGQVFSGAMQPQEYSRHKHDLMQRLNQLDLDTWGPNSPGASLSAAYGQLSQQFGLQDQTLTDQQWFGRYDAFLPAWDQLLQSADPSTRAAWWEHHTQQWTDADYLEWEAQQLKTALAASIDGRGGAYIRYAQNQLFQLRPYMSTADFTALEQSDPYYSAYRSLLQNVGMTSPLGAFVSAFSSPFSTTTILPAGLTEQEAQQVAGQTGGVAVRAEEAQQLAQQARQVAQEPQVVGSGGQALASPEIEQAAQQAAAQG